MKRPAPKRRYSLQSKTLITHRRRKILVISLGVLSIPTLFFSVLSFVSYVDVFQFKEIKVNGAITLSDTYIRSTVEQLLVQPKAFVFSRNNIILYPKDAIASAVFAYNPRIKNVVVSGGLHSLTITIQERTFEALWFDQDNQCSYVDKEGLIYEKATSTPSATMFKFTGYIEQNHVPYFTNAITFVRGLSQFSMHATSLNITPEADGEVLTTEGFTIKIALAQNPTDRLDVLKMLLTDQTLKEKIESKKLEYIDIRFGNKVYYKPH